MVRIDKYSKDGQKYVEFIVNDTLTYEDLCKIMSETETCTNEILFIFNLHKMTDQEEGDSLHSLFIGIIQPLIEKDQFYSLLILPENYLMLICDLNEYETSQTIPKKQCTGIYSRN